MKHVILIGFMGSGKSTLASLLSPRLNLPIFSTDLTIEKKIKMPISQIFKTFGEDFFRQEEDEVFFKIKALQTPYLIDCGGGFGAYQNVNELGVVVFLDIKINEIYKRLNVQEKAKRPLAHENLERLFKTRHQIYHQKADVILKGSESLEEIIRILQERA